MGRARVGATMATGASLTLDSNPVRSGGDPLPRTRLNAAMTPDAALREPPHFGSKKPALGVVAPVAMQRAALEEHRRANARPVVRRIAMNVENKRGMGVSGNGTDGVDEPAPRYYNSG